MSNPDSFIDEVTEEVRRDQLFATMRKWGWVGVLAVAVIVGGAAFNEWKQARDARVAQATGDAVLAAMAAAEPADRIAALEAVTAEGDAAAVIDILAASSETDPASADALLAGVADNGALPEIYRDLAVMKRVALPDSPMSAEDKIAALEPLLAGGAFRVLAEEQMALAELQAGDAEAALTRLQNLINDAEAGDTLRERAVQLIVALGGEIE